MFRFGTIRTIAGVDVCNALRDYTVLTDTNTVVPGGTWLQPQSIPAVRMVKVSAGFTV